MLEVGILIAFSTDRLPLPKPYLLISKPHSSRIVALFSKASPNSGKYAEHPIIDNYTTILYTIQDQYQASQPKKLMVRRR